MSAPAAAPLMTSDELLALPENGTERWLIRGRLREKPMTVRNREHSRIMIRIGQLLGNWLDQQPEPRGEVVGGEAGCRLRRNPDTVVGIDVAYLSPQLAAHQPADTTLIDGVPTLVVHRGREYGVGGCRPTCHHADMQARMDAEPRAVRVLASMRDADGKLSVGEFLFHLDRGPSGHELAGGGEV